MAWGAGYFTSIGPFKTLANRALAPVMLKEGETTSPSHKLAADLVSGFAAGVFGAALNTPGDTVRSVVMKRAFSGPPGAPNPKFFDVAAEIVRERGAASLYSGFGFKAMHLGGGGACMALAAPRIKAALDRRSEAKK